MDGMEVEWMSSGVRSRGDGMDVGSGTAEDAPDPDQIIYIKCCHDNDNTVIKTNARVVQMSGTLAALLTDGVPDSGDDETQCTLPVYGHVDGTTMGHIVAFMEHHAEHHAANGGGRGQTYRPNAIGGWDAAFVANLSFETMVALYNASDYLVVQPLCDLLAAYLAERACVTDRKSADVFFKVDMSHFLFPTVNDNGFLRQYLQEHCQDSKSGEQLRRGSLRGSGRERQIADLMRRAEGA